MEPSRIITNQHVSFELPKTWPPGAPSTDVPGPTKIDTQLHGGYKIQMPNRVEYDPY
ncbi:hypothetical protein DPMN_005275 [Dreissena polymorpha]|uniref:Uncharacterized protein n=1 Tax=Dreissena polymorpha TaxID=45954 RepID=A0A9D4MSD5_DREPO|nr:hypothetical protein DPMN_005275 [Dreissena polymorpha]